MTRSDWFSISIMIVNEYNTEDLPKWSDAKLKANIDVAYVELEHIENWENSDFLDGLLREEDRRQRDDLANIHSDNRRITRETK